MASSFQSDDAPVDSGETAPQALASHPEDSLTEHVFSIAEAPAAQEDAAIVQLRDPDISKVSGEQYFPPGSEGYMDVIRGFKPEKMEHAENNVANRFELFLLSEGEKKIVEEADNRSPNTSMFIILKEDHTLLNLLRAHLIKTEHVIFAGYRQPHPLFARLELRVQTDGEITPKEALLACCAKLVADLGHLSREFTKEYELRKMVQGEGGTITETLIAQVAT